MRKFFHVTGIVAMVIVAAELLGFAFVTMDGVRLDEDSKDYVDRAVSAISAEWKAEELIDRAAPELLQVSPPPQVSAFFKSLSSLGPLTRYRGSTGGSHIAINGLAAATVTATYSANAQFDKGDALFRLTLVRHDGKWMIGGFHVDRGNSASNTGAPNE